VQVSKRSPKHDGVIQIQDVHKKFDKDGKELHILRGIDLTMAKGDLVSIQGRSGAGKSTFLHILGTLDRPSRGKILFGGEDVFRYTSAKLAHFRNEWIGFVFQFHHLLPEFTALENVMMPALINRRTRADALDRAKHLLDRVGLSQRTSHKPGELSGGEQQRVALARALVMDPKLLLADEPTGNLDNATGQGIHDLFKEFNRDNALTIVIVTHDRSLAERMERRLIMKEGALGEMTHAPSSSFSQDTPHSPGQDD